jgi:hypothetical protein
LASGSVIFVALVATGTYLFHREAPLLGSRPAVTEASFPERAAPQTIDARLWQDPFAAVAKWLDKLGKRELAQHCLNEPSDDSGCDSPLKDEDNETLVVGITTSGTPYSEDAEQRRRTRYAVLAGLERAGFVPRDARHIGYFWLTQKPRPSAALQMPSLGLLQFYQQWQDRNKRVLTNITTTAATYAVTSIANLPGVARS